MSTFLVRPSNTEKEAFRIKLTAVSLLALKLKSGDLCNIQIPAADDNDNHDEEGAKGAARPVRPAIAWEASGNGMKDTVVQTSKFLQELYGFRLGERIAIARAVEPLRDAAVVQLVRTREVAEPFDEQQRLFWEYYAQLTVKGVHECVAVSQVLSFRVGAESQALEVVDVGVPDARIARVTENTRFGIRLDSALTVAEVSFNPRTLGGLQSEITQVQRLVDRLLRPKIPPKYPPVQGLLIYGAKGVGKSRFIEELSLSGWNAVIKWSPGSPISISSQPTLVVIHSLDLPSSQNATKPALKELQRLFDTVHGKPCLIVSETRHPNDVDSYLRSAGNFEAEIEIPIPSALQRKQILTAMRGTDPEPSQTLLDEMAERTHGYVAADLHALVRRTLELASERAPDPSDPPLLLPPPPTDPALPPTSPSCLTTPPPSSSSPSPIDLTTALTQIRPSALQEIILEIPRVHWTDIGGYSALKRALHRAVTWPLLPQQAARMTALALRPKKGILLYGPPGCSKTLLVRALATETGVNFLAVKGAELLSMYVGESERATREVFRKARGARPCIVFFDEIDAVASARGSGSGSGEVNVLTTLLNEMDGFEELKDVLVVAATNKPRAIDTALLRPGRFDNVVYVGPPDSEARREIFEREFRRSSGYRVEIGVREDADGFAALTERVSGAEVVAICQAAGERAMEEERDYYTADDVRVAIAGMAKSITPDMVEEFEAWNRERMS